MNLIGEYNHNVDKKKRVFVPAEFRIGKNWVITAGLEKCLFLFPENEWKKVTEKIMSMPLAKKDARGFSRFLLSRAKKINTDSQGRILIPERLISFSSITSSCTFIGMVNRIELWNPDEWEKYSKKCEDSYSDLAENMTEIDF